MSMINVFHHSWVSGNSPRSRRCREQLAGQGARTTAFEAAFADHIGVAAAVSSR